MTKLVSIAPFQTVHISGLTECDHHFKRVNVIVEPDPNKDYESVSLIHGYTVLKLGSSRVSVGLRNFSCRKVTIPAKSIIAKVTAANVVPHSLAPNLDSETTLEQLQNQDKNVQSETPEVPKLTPEKEKLLFDKIDLSGVKKWDPKLIDEAKQLFRGYAPYLL